MAQCPEKPSFSGVVGGTSIAFFFYLRMVPPTLRGFGDVLDNSDIAVPPEAKPLWKHEIRGGGCPLGVEKSNFPNISKCCGMEKTHGEQK